jgi:hypothetical protein
MMRLTRVLQSLNIPFIERKRQKTAKSLVIENLNKIGRGG